MKASFITQQPLSYVSLLHNEVLFICTARNENIRLNLHDLFAAFPPPQLPDQSNYFPTATLTTVILIT